MQIEKQMYKATLYSYPGKGIDPKPAFPNSYYRRKDTGGLRSGHRKKKYTVADSTGEIAEFKRQLNGSELFIRKRRPTLIRKEKRCGCSQFRGSNGKNIHQIIGWRRLVKFWISPLNGKHDEKQLVEALCLPKICQKLKLVPNIYRLRHLTALQLADDFTGNSDVFDVVIGLDYY
ncbi:hypothetical protein T4E_6720 [Trichinella pseudospiralis]|uniref:Peptidase aspartic putative domain-containing protein n=1 Tax=Trichinella pseudospiralis TaxID=6337 RepID=A0A0V0XHH5_TRIPS|nr:hypothetical protein T4E_6720 [Trichinella pseudospiralis]